MVLDVWINNTEVLFTKPPGKDFKNKVGGKLNCKA